MKLFSYNKEEKLDKEDKKILQVLGYNSRLSTIELAKKTKLTSRIVGYRIKQLEKRKIILQDDSFELEVLLLSEEENINTLPFF